MQKNRKRRFGVIWLAPLVLVLGLASGLASGSAGVARADATSGPAAPAAAPAGASPAPAASVPAADQGFADATYTASFKALFQLFVLAALLESGLAVIFNWRPFIMEFDSRGMKTIISVVISYVFINVFNLDIVTKLVNAYSGTALPNSLPGMVLTALILSGGSSGVNNILVGLGFRSVKTPEQAGLKPQASEAWVSVCLNRKAAIGAVQVLIGKKEIAAAAAAGTISGKAHPWPIISLFVQDHCRFPTSGGFALPPDGEGYVVLLEGWDGSKTIRSAVWGPYPLVAGAMVDLTMEL